MIEKPIPFTAPMVRAILAGRKTQTRRIIVAPKWSTGISDIELHSDGLYAVDKRSGCFSKVKTAYSKGDLLWVKESFADTAGMGFDKRFHYAADVPKGSDSDQIRKQYGVKWKSGRYMPRAASRITLRVLDVRFQRIGEISEQDAHAEGCEPAMEYLDGMPIGYGSTIPVFRDLWTSIHGPSAWDRNDWVAAYTFERVK